MRATPSTPLLFQYAAMQVYVRASVCVTVHVRGDDGVCVCFRVDARVCLCVKIHLLCDAGEYTHTHAQFAHIKSICCVRIVCAVFLVLRLLVFVGAWCACVCPCP